MLIAGFLLAVTVQTSASAAGEILDLRAIANDPAAFDGRTLTIRGFFGGEPGMHFACAGDGFSGADACRGIDIVEAPGRKRLSRVIGKEGTCGVATGKFTSFTNGRIGLGSFRSEIGYLDASKLRKIPCADLH